jgi:HK97 family phage portal protein
MRLSDIALWFKPAEPVALSLPPPEKFEVTIPPEMREFMIGTDALAPRITRAEALQVPAVLRSRNLIAGTLATLPVHVYNEARERSHPTTLLDQIDPDVSNVVTYAQTYEDLLFEGISWWRVRKFGWHGYPIEAQHIDRSRVHVSASAGIAHISQSRVPITGKVYIDGQLVADEEVIRFDSPNPPLLVHAARAIRTCLRLDRTASRYADEPLPLGVFTPKDADAIEPDEEEIQAMLDNWEQSRRSRAWGYVGSALDVNVLQFNAEQIQLAEQRNHAVLEIARAAGIDPEDLGVSTTSRTYQNAEQRRLDLLDFTLKAYVSAVEQRLTMRDVLPRGYMAKVNLDGFLRSDTMTRMQAYAIGLPVGAYTRPEIRALENKPDLTAAEREDIAPEAVNPQVTTGRRGAGNA